MKFNQMGPEVFLLVGKTKNRNVFKEILVSDRVLLLLVTRSR